MAGKRSSVQARKEAVKKNQQWKRWEKRITGGVLGLLALIAVVFVYSIGQGQDPAVSGLTTAPEVGALAPDFALPDKDGATLKLSDYRGRPVAVTFMHTW